MTKARRKTRPRKTKTRKTRATWWRPLRELRRRRLARLKRAQAHDKAAADITRLKAERKKTRDKTRARRRAQAHAAIAAVQARSDQRQPGRAPVIQRADSHPPQAAAPTTTPVPSRVVTVPAAGLCNAPTRDGTPCQSLGDCPHHKPTRKTGT